MRVTISFPQRTAILAIAAASLFNWSFPWSLTSSVASCDANLKSVKISVAKMDAVNSSVASMLNKEAGARTDVAYGKLPLSFEANHGQEDSAVRFVARG